MEVKICVDFLYKDMPDSKFTLEQTKEFDLNKIPDRVDCPPNCLEFAVYFKVRDRLIVADKGYKMETNRLNAKNFRFNESDPVHFPHSVQVADMLKRVKVPKFSVNGPLQLIHYVAFDNILHIEFDCRDVRVVDSNRLKDIVVPEGANRFETFDRYVYPLNINGEEVYLFTTEELNKKRYFIGYLTEDDRLHQIKSFETVDGHSGLASEKDGIIDPRNIDSNGKIIMGSYGFDI